MNKKLKTLGPVDIHFHGAFGVDLMSASPSQLTELSRALWNQGIAGFCPTTLSSPKSVLSEAVGRLGRWIRSGRFPGAKPLGIHLEGPFISPMACGAHPPASIRPLNWDELNQLWETSLGTLKILTVAPDDLNTGQLRRLSRWCTAKSIHLSLGHSHTTEAGAEQAFKAGFRGVTHAWNALPFHHRQPGVLGAALGRPDVYLELMIDQVHLSPTLIRWTRTLHPTHQICFISDCLSAAGCKPSIRKGRTTWHSLGNLRVRYEEGASRLKNGQLAGGGLLLTESYQKWLRFEASRSPYPLTKLFQDTVHHITTVPIQILRLPPSTLRDRQVTWKVSSSTEIDVIPIDSNSGSR